MNIQHAYRNALRDIMSKGTKSDDRTGDGTTRMFGMRIEHDFAHGFPLLTDKSVHFKSVMTELFWFLSGRNDMLSLWRHACHIWDADFVRYKKDSSTLSKLGDITTKFSNDEDILMRIKKATNPNNRGQFIKALENEWHCPETFLELGAVYGTQWKKQEWLWVALDRIAKEITDGLSQDSKSSLRRLVLSSWHPDAYRDVVWGNSALPPCHALAQFGIRAVDGGWAIDIEMYQRSGDMFLGVPFNIASYGLLLEIVAHAMTKASGGRAKFKAGKMAITLGDAHIYNSHIPAIEELLSRDDSKLPHLPFLEIILSEDMSAMDFVASLDGLFSNDATPYDSNLCDQQNLGFIFRMVGYNPLPPIKAPLVVGQ